MSDILSEFIKTERKLIQVDTIKENPKIKARITPELINTALCIYDMTLFLASVIVDKESRYLISGYSVLAIAHLRGIKEVYGYEIEMSKGYQNLFKENL